MSVESLIQTDSESKAPPRLWLDDWLPSRQQMSNAVQFQFDPPKPSAVVTEQRSAERAHEWNQSTIADNVWAISMRQGMGLVIAMALLAGTIPFFFNWVQATRIGAVVPLAEFAQLAARNQAEASTGPGALLWETGATIAGLDPVLFPGWLAATLSALGMWLNGTFRWLTIWLVYGLGVLAAAKLLGARTTLQRFYALTAYGSIPLVLTGLGPIPCLGAIASLIGGIWAFLVYMVAVRAATGSSTGHAFVSVVLPAAIVVLIGILIITSVVATITSFLF